MLEAPSIESMKRYLNWQMKSAELESHAESLQLIAPFITISRQTGAGGITIGQKAIQILNAAKDRKSSCPWTVFDKELVQVVLDEHNLPKSMAKFMPEANRSEFSDTVEEVLGLHPASMALVRNTAETILHLARLGYAVIVGRGANIITRRMSKGLHVRIVGSIEKRTAHAAAYYKMDSQKAKAFVEKEDKGRSEYIKAHYGKNVDDPLLYDFVINTDRISYDSAAQAIADAVRHL